MDRKRVKETISDYFSEFYAKNLIHSSSDARLVVSKFYMEILKEIDKLHNEECIEKAFMRDVRNNGINK
jgi:hypothetical protein